MRTRFIAAAAATTLTTGMLVVPGAGAETSSSALRAEIAAAEKAVKWSLGGRRMRCASCAL